MDNKEYNKIKMRKWRAANPDKVLAANKRKWERIKKNPELKKKSAQQANKSRKKRLSTMTEEEKRLLRKVHMLKFWYGISLEDYIKLLESQEYKCRICDEFLEDPHVDHCHSSGTVRGILCRGCNVGLGFFKDNTKNILEAYNYLKRFENIRS